MENDIRAIIAKYGYQAVREYLDNDMKQTYQYLKSYFSSKNNSGQYIHTNLENGIIHPTTQIQDVLLTTEIPQSIHVEKQVSTHESNEKTVSLANSQSAVTKSGKVKKGKQLAFTKVPEEPVQNLPPPTPQKKIKKSQK
jgi:hypothetical protein